MIGVAAMIRSKCNIGNFWQNESNSPGLKFRPFSPSESANTLALCAELRAASRMKYPCAGSKSNASFSQRESGGDDALSGADNRETFLAENFAR